MKVKTCPMAQGWTYRTKLPFVTKYNNVVNIGQSGLYEKWLYAILTSKCSPCQPHIKDESIHSPKVMSYPMLNRVWSLNCDQFPAYGWRDCYADMPQAAFLNTYKPININISWWRCSRLDISPLKQLRKLPRLLISAFKSSTVYRIGRKQQNWKTL
jgi:hypothetical protein